MCFVAIFPCSAYTGLLYLDGKKIYSNITIDMTCLPNALTNFTDELVNSTQKLDDLLEQNENHQHRYQGNYQESVLIPNIPTSEEIRIGSDEEKTPDSC